MTFRKLPHSPLVFKNALTIVGAVVEKNKPLIGSARGAIKYLCIESDPHTAMFFLETYNLHILSRYVLRLRNTVRDDAANLVGFDSLAPDIQLFFEPPQVENLCREVGLRSNRGYYNG